MHSVITYTIAHICMFTYCEHVCYKVIAQDESALPLTMQHWTRINKPINRSVEWPERRFFHATTCVSGSLLVIVGGLSGQNTISDSRICDLTTKQWKKV